jgi:ferritin-like metal-binding protein YciE
MANNDTFEGLYREQLAELHDAERQILEELPAIIRAASSQELKASLELHLEQTREQVTRLETIFANMPGPRPKRSSDPMRAMLAVARLRIINFDTPAVRDAAVTAAAQQVEHYEISGYGAALMLARMLNREHAAVLLQRTLEEEQDTAADLSEIAETIIMGEELDDAELEEVAS